MDKLLAIYNKYDDVIGWVPDVFLILALTTTVYFAQKLILSNIIHRSRVEKNLYLNTILHAITAPVSVCVWVVGLLLVAMTVRDFYNGLLPGLGWVDQALRVAVILGIGWFLSRLSSRAEHNLVYPVDGRKPVDKTTALAIGRIANIAILVIVVLVIMQTLSIDVAGIITLGSAGTLVLGFAAKDMLANFFGGFMIFSDKPFKVGDWIKSPDKNIEGYVEHIGWRVTRIRTFEKRPLYVQNATFLNISIENPSRMSNRRIKEVIGLRYCDIDKVKHITAEVEKMLAQHPEIDTKQTIFVALNHFGDSTLDCMIYCFTKTTQWVEYLHVQEDVFVKIADIVKKHGADMAFPTRTIEMPDSAFAK